MGSLLFRPSITAPSNWSTNGTTPIRRPLVKGEDDAEIESVITACLKDCPRPFFSDLIGITVERVENYSLYKAHQEFLIKNSIKPKMYLHGTNGENVNSIVFNGFDRKKIGTHASLYGEGFYFGKTLLLPLDYSTTDLSFHKYIIMLSVARGKCALGSCTTKVPPEGFHSTTDSLLDKEICVTYDEHQQYASYVLTLDMMELIYFLVGLTTCTTIEAHDMIVTHLKKNNNYASFSSRQVVAKYDKIRNANIETDDQALAAMAMELCDLVGHELVYDRCSVPVKQLVSTFNCRKQFHFNAWQELWSLHLDEQPPSKRARTT